MKDNHAAQQQLCGLKVWQLKAKQSHALEDYLLVCDVPCQPQPPVKPVCVCPSVVGALCAARTYAIALQPCVSGMGIAKCAKVTSSLQQRVQRKCPTCNAAHYHELRSAGQSSALHEHMVRGHAAMSQSSSGTLWVQLQERTYPYPCNYEVQEHRGNTMIK